MLVKNNYLKHFQIITAKIKQNLIFLVVKHKTKVTTSKAQIEHICFIFLSTRTKIADYANTQICSRLIFILWFSFNTILKSTIKKNSLFTFFILNSSFYNCNSV